MGRLQALTATTVAMLSMLALGGGCRRGDEQGSSPITTRSDSVLASSPAATTRSAVPSSSATRDRPSKPHTVCAGPPLDRPFPTERVAHVEVQDAPVLGDVIPTGGGRWTWISLWAAWCVPCKEEMPRLVQWQRKLASQLALVFLSLDDDQRELLRFLQSQPSSGVRASFWLPEGTMRDNWLRAAKIKSFPQLPMQILVNPMGKEYCVVEGAVEDSDFANISAIVSRR